MNFPRYSYAKFLLNGDLFRSWLLVTPIEWADIIIRDEVNAIADELVEIVRLAR